MSIESMISAVTKDGGPIRIPELGKIKIGGLGESRPTKSGGKFRLPRKDDFFTITGLVRNKDGDLIPDVPLMASLTRQYGDKDGKLRQLPIRLLSDNMDQILQARFCCYGGRTCWAWSDGEKVTWRVDPKTRQPLQVPLVQDWTPEHLEMRGKDGSPIFKLHANFACSIHSEEGRWGGVYLFRTTSVISFRQLYASILEISEKTGGVLVGMPLMLCVRPMLVTPDGKPTNVYVVHVEVRGKDLQQLQQLALEQAKFRLQFSDNIQKIQRQYQKLLVAPGEESLEEAAEIADEFAPAEPDANVIDGTSGPASVSDLLADEPHKPPKEEQAPEPDASEAPAETEPEGQ